jgi:Fingers domain of DNA polymerase lambda
MSITVQNRKLTIPVDVTMKASLLSVLTPTNHILKGCRSLEDLASKATLNRHQKIGLDLFDDLDLRMDRSEAAEIEAAVRAAADELREGS